VEVIVVSVGPYWFTSRPGTLSRPPATRNGRSDSPLHTVNRRAGKPLRRSEVRNVGVAESIVFTPHRRTAATNALLRSSVERGTRTTRPPATSGAKVSRIAAS
jgi:hypothetical protein